MRCKLKLKQNQTVTKTTSINKEKINMKRNKQSLIKHCIAALLVLMTVFSFQAPVMGIGGEAEGYPELTLLRSAVDQIRENDKELAAELSIIVDTMQTSLKLGLKEKAAYSLRSLASLVYFDKRDILRWEVRLDYMSAVVKTQTDYDLPSGVEEHPGQCCDNQWPGQASCKESEKEGAVCYTIKGKQGCLGTPCS
ncbi:MAG: hypothetical protein GY940_05925 [bacterium]|nr:hypothetical protein [bacterium]